MDTLQYLICMASKWIRQGYGQCEHNHQNFQNSHFRFTRKRCAFSQLISALALCFHNGRARTQAVAVYNTKDFKARTSVEGMRSRVCKAR